MNDPNAWKRRAACGPGDLPRFYDAKFDAWCRAKCMACPVRAECLEDEMTTTARSEHIDGFRAGLGARARRKLYRDRYPTFDARPEGFDHWGDSLRKAV